LLLAGLKPIRMAAPSSPKASLLLHTQALTRLAHDWAGPVAPSPMFEGRSLAAITRAQERASETMLPLFEVEKIEAPEDDVSDNADAGRGHITQRLRAGLARGAKSKTR